MNLATGGMQYNIVAEQAVVEYDVRTLPQVTTESFVERIDRELSEVILPDLQARAARAEKLTGAEPGSLTSRVGVKHELLAAVPVWVPRTTHPSCTSPTSGWAPMTHRRRSPTAPRRSVPARRRAEHHLRSWRYCPGALPERVD